MSNKYFISNTKRVKIDTISSEPVSLEESDTPKHLIPSLNSIGAPSSNRSCSSSHRSVNSMHHLTPVNDFKRSIENEKNIRQLMNKFESIAKTKPTASNNSDKMLTILEKNYSLQIQTLLEEVNHLKLEKKILENKSQTASNKPSAASEVKDSQTQNYKMTLKAKDSTINELEFQITQMRKENDYLKLAHSYQKTELTKLTNDLLETGNLKCKLDDHEDEISILREKLSMKDTNHAKLVQELQQVHTENLQLKFRSHNNSVLAGGDRHHISRDHSFCSAMEVSRHPTHQRSCSDYVTRGAFRLPDLSEMQVRDHNATDYTPKSSARAGHSPFGKDKDQSQILAQGSTSAANLSRSRISGFAAQGTSLKLLNEYERNLQREKENNPESEAKLSNRLLELKRIKIHYVEQENERLMAMLNSKRGPRRGQRRVRREELSCDKKSTDITLTYSPSENVES